MLTRDQIIFACELFTGRKPSDHLVERLTPLCSTVQDLRTILLSPKNVRRTLSTTVPSSILVDVDFDAALEIDVYTSQHILERMMSDVRHTWTHLGLTEPYWSVLTHKHFLQQSFSDHCERYFEQGRQDVERFQRILKRNTIRLPSLPTCLEYGSGTGRMSQWLAGLFSRLICTDISCEHLRLLKSHLKPLDNCNIDYIDLSSLSALMSLPKSDIVISILVLQHNPPPLSLFIVRNLLASLRAGGVAYLQIISVGTNYSFCLSEYLKRDTASDTMELHVLPQQYIFREATMCDCNIIEVYPDRYLGIEGWISNTFLIQKER